MINSDLYYQIIKDKLDEFIYKYYKNKIFKGLILFFTFFLILFLIVAIFEYYGEFNPSVRTILFYTSLIIIVLLISIFFINPLLKLFKLSKTISYEDASIIIGKHFPEISDKLLNIIQLKEKNNNNYSLELLEASIKQKTENLKPFPFPLAINFKSNYKYLKYLLIPLFILISILTIYPSILSKSTKRIIYHNTVFEKEYLFNILIKNKKLSVVQNQDYKLNIEVIGSEIPEKLFIKINNSNIELEMNKESLLNFFYTFKNVQKDLDFIIYNEDFISKKHTLKVIPNPVILDFYIELEYPKYINQKNKIINNTGDIQIPQGTVVKWNFNTVNTKNLLISFSDSIKYKINEKNGKFYFTKKIFKSKNYIIQSSNKFIINKDSLKFFIDVIPDLHPIINVENRKDSINEYENYFKIDIKDDYGFNKLTFNYRVYSLDNEKSKFFTSEKIEIDKKKSENTLFYFKNFAELVYENSIIEYFFEVWDNDAVNGSKSTKSNVIYLKTKSKSEAEKNINDINDNIIDKLNESSKEIDKIKKQTDDLKKKLFEKQNLSWEDKQNLKKMLENINSLEKSINEIRNDNLKNIQNEENINTDKSIIDKQKEISELFEQIMTDEMRKLIEELQSMFEEMDKNKMLEKINDLEYNNKDIEKELDRTLELFENMEFQQNLDKTIDKLEDLLNKQNELNKETEDKNNSNEELQKKQDNINKDYENVAEDLKNLIEKNEKLEKSFNLDGVNDLNNAVKEEMQNSSMQLNKNNRKNAQQSQKESVKSLESLLNKLNNIQKSFNAKKSEDINSLRQILDNILKLSFKQEELILTSRKTSINDQKFGNLGLQQKYIHEDVKLIEDSLFALSKRNIEIKSFINREISSINSNINEALILFKDRKMQEVYGKQQYSMTSLNNLALMLNEIIEQMQKQMQSNSPSQCSNGKCNNPGQTPTMPNIKQLQEQLNKQLSELKQKMKDGNKPDKSNKGKGEFSKEFAKMVAKQEAIRNYLNNLKNQLNSENQGLNKSLNSLIKKIEDSEKDLVNKILNEETINRQKEILSRMLEVEKSINQQNIDEKRTSKESKNNYNRNPKEIFEYNKKEEEENEILKVSPFSLKLYYKQKVNEYLRSLK